MPLTSRSKLQQPTAISRYSPDPPVSSDAPTPTAHLDETADIDWTFYVFCGMSCLVAGLVDGASLAGVYHEATSHLSGISTKLALRLRSPRHLRPPPTHQISECCCHFGPILFLSAPMAWDPSSAASCSWSAVSKGSLGRFKRMWLSEAACTPRIVR